MKMALSMVNWSAIKYSIHVYVIICLYLASTSTLCSQNYKLRWWIPHQCHHHTMIISWLVTALNQLSVCPHSSLSHSSWASRTTIRRIALWTFRPSLSPQAHRQLWLQEELFHSDKPRDNRGPNYRHPPPRYVWTIATLHDGWSNL